MTSRLFRARRPNDPRRLPSARPTALRPRWDASRKLVRLRFASRHPFTWCDGIRRRPRWWISASRYPRCSFERLAAPAFRDGQDAPHRLLQPTRDMCTSTDRPIPEVAAALSRGGHVRWSVSPSRRPGSRCV